MCSIKWVVAFVFTASLSGCAMTPASPPDTVQQLSVIDVSNNLSAARIQQHDYIIHVPAGETFDINVKIGGSLLSDEVVQRVPVRLSRDLYVYKSWASFDKVQWKNSHELLNIAVSGGLEPGASRIEFLFDIKNGQ